MEVTKPLLPYHVEDILKLHGRIYSELSGDDLILFDLYAQKGREFGIACQIINQADPDKVLRAVSYDHAIGIMRKAGSRVAVFKTADHFDTKYRVHEGSSVGSSATYQAGPHEGMGDSPSVWSAADQDVERSLDDDNSAQARGHEWLRLALVYGLPVVTLWTLTFWAFLYYDGATRVGALCDGILETVLDFIVPQSK